MQQCVSAQFTADGGVLHLSRSAMPRIVLESKSSSLNDGPVDGHSPMKNQKIMIEQRAHWKNDFGVPVNVQVQIQRSRRTMSTTCPHTLFMRETYTTRVGTDGRTQVLAPEPTTHPTWNTEWGGGNFAPFNSMQQSNDNKPEWPAITMWQSTPEATTTLNQIRVDDGQSLDVRFRVGLVTDAYVNVPWQDAKPRNNYPIATAYAFSNVIRFFAFPEPI